MNTSPSTGTTILVAEDDRAIRFSLACSLKAEGYGVIETGDGDEALARIERDHPDGVLHRCREGVLGSPAVVHGHGRDPRPAGDRPAHAVVGLQVPEHPAAAVEEPRYARPGRLAVGGAGGR